MSDANYEYMYHKEEYVDKIQKACHAASPGGRARPAMDYSKGQRGDGKGRPIADSGT